MPPHLIQFLPELGESRVRRSRMAAPVLWEPANLASVPRTRRRSACPRALRLSQFVCLWRSGAVFRQRAGSYGRRLWPGAHLSATGLARTLPRVTDADLLARINVNPAIFGGKPIVRGRRLAVEHVLAMLAKGDDIPTILEGYPWLEREDVLACIEYARRLVGHETIGPLHIDKKSA